MKRLRLDHLVVPLLLASSMSAGCLGGELIDDLRSFDHRGHPHGGTGGNPGGSGGAGGGQVGSPCGGFVANATACAPGLFCEGPFPSLACNPDVGGTCRMIPEVCPQLYAPVCGCDGKTYANDCERQGAGVSKASDGACAVAGSGGATGSGGTTGGGSGGATGGGSGGTTGGVGDFCGGFVANPRACGPGLFCDGAFPTLACNPDVGGTCQEVPQLCPQIFVPVCGCDGKTYPNDCQRQAARVSKRSNRACDAVCIENLLCVRGSHFDNVACSCVPN